MSARRFRRAVLAFIVVLVPVISSFGQYVPSVPVQGQVQSRKVNGPAPGLKIYLVHRSLGRSAPSFTDAYGRFGWTAIPIRRDEPYYLEIFWGQNLIYRQPLTVTAPLALPTIYL